MTMKNKVFKTGFLLTICCFSLIACEDYVDVESPNFIIGNENVFNNDETALAAVNGIYNELARAGFSDGYTTSVTLLAGLSSDIFETTSDTDTRYGPFQQNELLAIGSDDSEANYELWSSAYNIIYMTNSVIEGVENSSKLSEHTRNIAYGQALFVRAFANFYLINLYGDVPLILSTNYSENRVKNRDDVAEVYEQIVADLDMAKLLLEEINDYPNSERTSVNRYTVIAFQARVYLYLKQWDKAEQLSSQIIEETSKFELLEDLDEVFLKNSREAIWQISPLGRGVSTTFTQEGYMFRGNNSSKLKLSEKFISFMENEDLRARHWIGYNSEKEFYYPQKYKDGNSRNNVTEYSMVLRFAEQYLIRAEARIMQGKLKSAIADINIIRSRANIELISKDEPEMKKQPLLNILMNERKVELFSEWGHRWLDLKRNSIASEILSPIKLLWQDTDVLYPIPGEERLKHPSLGQNNGY